MSPPDAHAVLRAFTLLLKFEFTRRASSSPVVGRRIIDTSIIEIIVGIHGNTGGLVTRNPAIVYVYQLAPLVEYAPFIPDLPSEVVEVGQTVESNGVGDQKPVCISQSVKQGHVGRG